MVSVVQYALFVVDIWMIHTFFFVFLKIFLSIIHQGKKRYAKSVQNDKISDD